MMDRHAFDHWTMTLAHRQSRRIALQLLLGGVLGSLLSQRVAAPTRGAQLPPDLLLGCAAIGLTDCGGVCADLSSDEFNCGACFTACGGLPCLDGVCSAAAVVAPGPLLGPLLDVTPGPPGCNNGLTDCGGVCADLSSNAGHCGACYNACPLGSFCQGGVCAGLVCLDGLTDCGTGSCLDLSSDWSHCGACNAGCFSGTSCVNGQCV
jgi:hypothetical protein